MSDDLDLEALYRAERRDAATRYMQRDRVGYARILVAVTVQYHGQPGGYRRLMAEVQRRCAEANYFPDYETWQSQREVTTA